MQIQAVDALILGPLFQGMKQGGSQAAAPILWRYEQAHNLDGFLAVKRELREAVVVGDVSDDGY